MEEEYSAPFLDKPHYKLDCQHELDVKIIYGELDWKKNKLKIMLKIQWWKDQKTKALESKGKKRKLAYYSTYGITQGS